MLEPRPHRDDTGPLPRLGRVSLTTRDLARSRAFYSGTLGFPVVADGAASFAVDAGGVLLAITLDGGRQPLGHVEPRLEFEVEALAWRCRELRDRGVSVDGPRSGGTRRGAQAELTDPDGHPIVLREIVV